jgi:hypothetical protein
MKHHSTNLQFQKTGCQIHQLVLVPLQSEQPGIIILKRVKIVTY